MLWRKKEEKCHWLVQPEYFPLSFHHLLTEAPCPTLKNTQVFSATSLIEMLSFSPIFEVRKHAHVSHHCVWIKMTAAHVESPQASLLQRDREERRESWKY